MRRLALFALVILTAVILQTAVFARLSLFRVSPDLILVAVIAAALVEGPAIGATAGFGGGLLRDLLLDAPRGLTGLAYLIVAYAIGSVRPYVQSTSVFVPVAGVFLGTLCATSLYIVLSVLLGQPAGPAGAVVQEVVLTAVYNTLLVPFVYPVVRKLLQMYRREKVYRWS